MSDLHSCPFCAALSSGVDGLLRHLLQRHTDAVPGRRLIMWLDDRVQCWCGATFNMPILYLPDDGRRQVKSEWEKHMLRNGGVDAHLLGCILGEKGVL